MKNIIFCADGTWDAPPQQTNVYRLYRALATTPTQIALYDDGVGADGNRIEQLLGGAIGFGLFGKIKDGYQQIAQLYEPGDGVYLFGFSRGAFTARSLAGMIAVCGLPSGSFDSHLVEQAFLAYRTPLLRQNILAQLAAYKLDDAKLQMVGVWDTVGSLGIPALVGGVDPILYGFLDTSLHPDVLCACQALAIDEKRKEFPPTLWTTPASAQQVIEQVWYCGVHSDVGGGYGQPGLADIPLRWMMGQARARGLVFAAAPSVDAGTALLELHNSWSILWGIPQSRTIAPSATLANSVSLRLQGDGSYLPPSLTLAGRQPAASYTIETVV
ncbi:MAG: DUF2235 domain-containing protein [Terriglobales bacterium]